MANNTWSLDFLTIKNVAFFTGNEKKDIKEKHRHSVLSYTLFFKEIFYKNTSLRLCHKTNNKVWTVSGSNHCFQKCSYYSEQKKQTKDHAEKYLKYK